MAILNLPSNGQPSVLIALWRTLSAVGPIEADRLLDLCAPKPLRDLDTQKQASRTLHTWIDLGLFCSEDDSVHVARGFATTCTDPAQDPLLWEMRTAALDIAMLPENNEDVGNPTEEGARGVADFSYAICWMLSQDPHQNWNYNLADSRQGAWIQHEGRRPIQNNTRWSPLVDWACFFGLGWTVGLPSEPFFVDPTEAIRRRLKRIFGENVVLPQSDFVARLTEELPILHTGSYRKAAERHFPEENRVGESEFSVALSHALLTLESTGEIELRNDPDAGLSRKLSSRRSDYMIARGRTSSITHVVLGSV